MTHMKLCAICAALLLGAGAASAQPLPPSGDTTSPRGGAPETPDRETRGISGDPHANSPQQNNPGAVPTPPPPKMAPNR